MIFNIRRYLTHDGSGIHMVVFLKSYSLGCRWCQNLESRVRMQDLLYDPRLCLEDCKLCAKIAPEVIERASSGLLIHRGKLTPEYFAALTDCRSTQALTVCSKVRNIEEIIAAVLRDRPFYDHSGSNLTLPGDESFMQPEMAMALLQASHETGIHTTAETRPHVPRKHIVPSLPYIDLLLADLKYAANVSSRQWTDGDAARVLGNLKKLVAAGERIITHVSLIRDFSTDETSVKAITDFVAGELHVGEIHFLPYHTLGINKYHLLNLPYDAPEEPLDVPGLLSFAQQYICQKGLTATLRG